MGMPLVVALILLLAACGGAASPSADDGDPEQSTASEPSEAPASSDNNGDGNGNLDPEDLDGLAERLTPPNATEVTRTTAGGAIIVAYESTDSLESLTSLYENAIADAGMQVFSTTTANGGAAWVFADEEGSSFGGAVSLFPSGTGSGTSVTITLGAS